MEKKLIQIIAIIIVALLVVGGLLYFLWTLENQKSEKLKPFAMCLADSGVKFYGAFWCSHCQAQKALFGSAAKYLPYIECSTPDSNGQLSVCQDKNIETYPTWIFADGSIQKGEMSLQQLADKSGCALPQ